MIVDRGVNKGMTVTDEHNSSFTEEARTSLQRELTRIGDELRAYPTPVAGCDAQYNHLLAERQRIRDSLAALDETTVV